MPTVVWIVLGSIVAVAALAGTVVLIRRRAVHRRQRQLADAQRQFHCMREQLEAKFLQRAALTGRPRGLRWSDCEFENDVTYARDRQTGQLSAFVAVSIKFEAIEGGGMEEVEAVDNAKFATGVFHFDPKTRWTTDGRAIFNLAPTEAVRHFQSTLEPVGRE